MVIEFNSPAHRPGFHGDLYLLRAVDWLLERSHWFVETGSNVGTSLAYAARNHPHLRCLSCEPREEAFREAQEVIAHLRHAAVFHETSQEFLGRLSRVIPPLDPTVTFWLDAHGQGFRWPLRDEIDWITRTLPAARILIDDFMVPGAPEFGFDQYDGQCCSREYIEPALNSSRNYQWFWPAYREHTSPHHPLRGWVLLQYGYDEIGPAMALPGIVAQDPLPSRPTSSVTAPRISRALDLLGCSGE